MLSSLPPSTITLWKSTGLTASQEPGFAAPELIGGVFNRGFKVTFNESGEEKGVNNTFIIDREVSIGDFLIEGDFTAVADPRTINAVRVVNCIVRSNARGTEKRFVALG